MAKRDVVDLILGVKSDNVEAIDTLLSAAKTVGAGPLGETPEDLNDGVLFRRATNLWMPLITWESKRLLEQKHDFLKTHASLFTDNLGVVWKVNRTLQELIRLTDAPLPLTTTRKGAMMRENRFGLNLHDWMSPFTEHWMAYHTRRFDTTYIPKLLRFRGWLDDNAEENKHHQSHHPETADGGQHARRQRGSDVDIGSDGGGVDVVVVDFMTLLEGLYKQFTSLPKHKDHIAAFRLWAASMSFRVADAISALAHHIIDNPEDAAASVASIASSGRLCKASRGKSFLYQQPLRIPTCLPHCKHCLPLTRSQKHLETNAAKRGRGEAARGEAGDSKRSGKRETLLVPAATNTNCNGVLSVLSFFKKPAAAKRQMTKDTILFCSCEMPARLIDMANALEDLERHVHLFLLRSERLKVRPLDEKNDYHRHHHYPPPQGGGASTQQQEEEEDGGEEKAQRGVRYYAWRSLCYSRTTASFYSLQIMCPSSASRILSVGKALRLSSIGVFHPPPLATYQRVSLVHPPGYLKQTHIPLLAQGGKAGRKRDEDMVLKAVSDVSEGILKHVAVAFADVFNYILHEILYPGGRALGKDTTQDEVDDMLEPFWVYLLHHLSPIIPSMDGKERRMKAAHRSSSEEGCFRSHSAKILFNIIQIELIHCLEGTLMSQQQRDGGQVIKPLSAARQSPFPPPPTDPSASSVRCSTGRWRGSGEASSATASTSLSSSRYRGNSWDVIYGWSVYSSHQLTALRHALILSNRCLESFFGYTDGTQGGGGMKRSSQQTSQNERGKKMKRGGGGRKDSRGAEGGGNIEDEEDELSAEATRVRSMLNALGGSTASLVSLFKLTALEERKIQQRVKESYNRLKPQDMQAMLKNVMEGWRRKTSPHLFARDVQRVLLFRGIRDPLAWKEEEGVGAEPHL